MAKIVMVMVGSYSTVVEPLTSDREVEGSNPASNWPPEKKWKKKFERKQSKWRRGKIRGSIERGERWIYGSCNSGANVIKLSCLVTNTRAQ